MMESLGSFRGTGSSENCGYTNYTDGESGFVRSPTFRRSAGPDKLPDRVNEELQTLHLRLIPILAIIGHRILALDALYLFHTGLCQILRRAAPWPISPMFGVAVPHRIVMNIIQRRPVMPI